MRIQRLKTSGGYELRFYLLFYLQPLMCSLLFFACFSLVIRFSHKLPKDTNNNKTNNKTIIMKLSSALLSSLLLATGTSTMCISVYAINCLPIKISSFLCCRRDDMNLAIHSLIQFPKYAFFVSDDSFSYLIPFSSSSYFS